MELITSRDGTPIASWQRGAGDPLLLVHGTTSDHLVWTSVLAALEHHFSVWTLDRRGRGYSGDSGSYAFERECEDIATIIDVIGGRVHLLGHSFGGLCALEAILLTSNIGKLMLYEAPISLAGSGWSEMREATLQNLLISGNWEEAVLLFFRDILKAAPHEIAAMQAGSNWPGRVATAHTILRELQSVDKYDFNPHRFDSLRIPIMLLLGEDSPARRYQAAEVLCRSLCGSQIKILPGQQHGAMRTAPDLFAHEVIEFFR
ncbi:Pimeloyl-ACP methyl ester carboxylesterase [Nitrosomonas cryotolerans]|uniref:Pimeloyl-ACP methyl ester carboxylesterase n=1 Tax=Nitrosomonas cryotolerans ATCC 49181 TaxID=1131553 RepID=A0A1N6IX20_9PROT|nr:alpha/beta hydrolase [Nitrosomonas cryotolerans]SFP85775.1 Pimeloyl-ACP methyl ester carboxylesterase [Nitrosomonas cryotolerans]SIO36582.1 Pimeloyl-ACP methyl ester carboxylesterase [Nitrosomonas cryotolerans ATCC 49181]